jgi:tight adherence protein B
MLLIIIFVFLAVFTVITLGMIAIAGRSTNPDRVRATLTSALRISVSSKREEIVDVRKNDLLSSVPWIHQLLVQIKAAMELRRFLDQADLKWTPVQLILMAVMGWVVASYVINVRTELGILSLLFGATGGAAPFAYVWIQRRKRFNLFEKRLPDALDLIVSALRAGHSTIGALGMVANDAPEPIRREFRLCFEEQNFGVDMRAAMENLVNRVPLQDLRIITTAILIHKESGGNLAEVIEKTSHIVRDRFRLRDQIRVHTAQGTMGGWVMTLLPPVLGFVIYLVNPEYIQLLLVRPLGHKMIGLGVVMDLAGMLIVRKIIRIRV